MHGPYTADRFRNGDGAPNVTYGKAGLIRMDALASSSHIGLIYATNADGTDQIIEAKGEAYGTNIWTRTYRGDSELRRRPQARVEMHDERARTGGAPFGSRGRLVMPYRNGVVLRAVAERATSRRRPASSTAPRRRPSALALRSRRWRRHRGRG